MSLKSNTLSLSVVHHPCNRLDIIVKGRGRGGAPRQVDTTPPDPFEPEVASNIYLCRETAQHFRWNEKTVKVPQRTQFSRSSALSVQNAACILEQNYMGIAMFCTLTVPTALHMQLQVLSAASGEICKRLTKFILERAVGEAYVYVWEVQKRGAPHVHCILKLPHSRYVQQFYYELRHQWRCILLDVLYATSIDVFAVSDTVTWRYHDNVPVVNFQPVKTSVSRYLAKYMSKMVTKNNAEGAWYPGRWKSVSYELQRKVRQETLTFVCHTRDTSAVEVIESELATQLGATDTKFWRSPACEQFGIVKFSSFCARDESLNIIGEVFAKLAE
jgi:hypothetical protein